MGRSEAAWWQAVGEEWLAGKTCAKGAEVQRHECKGNGREKSERNCGT